MGYNDAQMNKEMTVYHGTNLLVAESEEDIFGIDDPAYPDICGTLTDDIEFARRWAIRKSEYNPDWARVVEFHIPEDELTDHGQILTNGARSLSTKPPVSLSEVPNSFLLEKDLRRTSAELMVQRGFIFYRVSRRYQTAIHTCK